MTDEKTMEQLPDNESALVRMTEEIEKQAKDQAKELINEAKERAAEIINQAKLEAQKIKQGILDQVNSEIEQIKVRELSRMRQSAKMDYLETRENVLEEFYVQAKSELQKFTKGKEYPAYLEKLVLSSALSIGGGDLVLQLRPEDKAHFSKESLDKIAKEVTKELGVETKISVSKEDLKALGGIKLIRSDNRLFIDNTFEQRLERIQEETRVALLELLN